MKKIAILLCSFMLIVGITGCKKNKAVEEKEKESDKTTFNITETAIVDDAKIKINSVKKVLSECSYEHDGKCYGETTPNNDFFLVIDVTIENIGEEQQNISSIMSFDLKDSSEEKGSYTFLTKNVSSQLDGTIMAGDSLKGQVAYDVKKSDTYSFYYQDSLANKTIKFTINKNDIKE